MKTLFSFIFENKRYELLGSNWTGLEKLYVDGNLVSKTRSFRFNSQHLFNLASDEKYSLAFQLSFKKTTVTFQLYKNNQKVLSDEVKMRMPEWLKTLDNKLDDKIANLEKEEKKYQQNPDNLTKQETPLTKEKSVVSIKQETAPVKHNYWIALTGLIFKLFQSAKVVKIALAGTAFAGWSVIFNWQFALVIILAIMFHEYGHVQAMKKFAIPTKGFYLIPFFGGVAIGDKAKTEWQELYISLMGPMYGLFMTLAFFLAYLTYNNHFIGLVASISALINLFNLFPIYPLDGGHAIKSMVFSGKKYWGIVFLLFGSALGFVISLKMGWYFISFFIVLGVLDLVFSWKELHNEDKIKMDNYGILFSLIWYLSIMAIFLTVITLMANSQVPGTEIARTILRS